MRTELARGPRSANAKPVLSARSRKSLGLHRLDPDATRVALADLKARGGAIGERIWNLAGSTIGPNSRRAEPLSMAKLFERAAYALFGGGAERRVRYHGFEKKLEAHGLEDALAPMMAALPRGKLKALRSRGLSPKELFRAGAIAMASWRASPDPMSEAQLRKEAAREGISAKISGFIDSLSLADRKRLAAGELNGVALSELFDEHRSHRAHLGIIGAGMAGIAAGNVAMDANVDVVLLEAKSHALGRVQSGNIEGIPFEVGGQWVHNRFENPLSQLAADLGYSLVPDDKFSMLIEDGRVSQKAGHELGERVEKLADEWAKGAVERPLSERVGPSKLDQLAAGVLAFEVARPLAEVSGAGISTLVPEKHDATIQGGMGRMLSALAVGLPIRTNTPVEKIEWGGEQVVVTAKGERYTFDKLVITIPPAVLRSGAIEFVPPLPIQIRTALAGFEMSSFEKILLRFDSNVFGTELENVRGVGVDAKGNSFEVDLRIGGTNAAVVLVGGDHAKELVKKDQQAAIAYGLEQLAGMLGDKIYADFVGGERTNWTQDPCALGAWNVPNVDAPKDAIECLMTPIDGKVVFAGEHLAETGWRTSIPGAMGSGKRAAEALLKKSSGS